jgi:hypothetical protein
LPGGAHSAIVGVMEAPPVTPEVRAALDAEHLRLLRLGYFIAGGTSAFFSCFLIFHSVFFLFLGLNPQMFNTPNQHGTPPPPGLFLGLAGVFITIMVSGWIFGALQIYAGICLGRRKHMTFVFIIAIIECLFLPWGTALGVLTLIVLSRPSAAALFREGGSVI